MRWAAHCVTSEYSHALGCYADVTSHVQDACSGVARRQNCSLLVATVDAIAQPCGKDFKSYLDIEHDCVAGTTVCDAPLRLLTLQCDVTLTFGTGLAA